MRIASILAATAAIGWLFATLWDLPVPRVLLLYTAWMGVITFCAYFVAQRIPQTEGGYAVFYTVMLGPLVVLVLLLALNFGAALGSRGISGLAVLAFLAAWFVSLFRAYTPDTFVTKLMLTQGYVFGICGLFTLASLVPPSSALQFRVRVTLGCYWLCLGVYAFVQSLGIVRSRALFESLSAWLASAMCVVFLGGLAWALRGIQPELGRQQVQDEQPVTLVWEAGE